MKFVNYLLILCLTGITISLSAQTVSAFLNRSAGLLAKHNAALPVEKVYLHLDKPNYNLGDTIWYKAYTVAGETHQLSALSGVLYTELINQKDSVISRHVLRLIAGLAWGDFALPHALKQGTYHIRAYTNWMRNADAEYFYNQVVRIGQPQILPLKQSGATKPDVQFFPEGGELVNGIRSRVAVKSINTYGLGEDIKGTIIDNENNEIAAFETKHLGMGVFVLIPQPGKSYRARITSNDGGQYTFDLPKANDEGYTLSVNNNDKDSIYVKVAANDKLYQAKQNSSFYLIAQSAGRIYYTSAAKLVSPVFTTRISKSRFPSGIVQFTLFSQNGEPLNERIAFLQNADSIKFSLSSSLQKYSPREKVKIMLDTKEGNGPVVAGSYSAAVINENRVAADENAEGTILNNLLLTSDLKGYVEKPNYYFINNNDQARMDLDVLMLTQGYRRFEWKQVLNDKNAIAAYQPEKELELNGTLKAHDGKVLPNGSVTLLATKESFLKDTVTDVNGNFKFTNVDLPDTAKLVLRARKQNNGSRVTIGVVPYNYPPIGQHKEADAAILLINQTAEVKKQIMAYQTLYKEDSLKNSRILKEVVVKEKIIKKQPALVNSSNLNGPGHADQVILGDKIEGCVKISDCLEGKVFGVTFKNGTPFSIRTQGRLSGQPPMVVIVDGIQLDGSSLDDLNANDVYSIEVLKSGAYLAVYGSNAPGGALVITTKRGGEGTNIITQSPSGLITYAFNGFYKARGFYNPKFTHAKTDSETLDTRSTIYWNPNMISDKDGKISFEYFDGDSKGTYKIVVEGINDNGNLGRKIYRYNVE